MENDYRVNIVSLEMDRDENESTLSNSLESGITSETSRSDDADSKLDECCEWTNERHNSYLENLENSFVKQLYSFLGGKTQRLSRTRDVQSNSHKSTDQFTVLQNGCWQKVNFGKKQAHLETSSKKKFLRNNHENTNRDYAMRSAVQRNLLCNEESEYSGDKAYTRASLRSSVGHKYRTKITAEASGQNFREEEKEEVSRKRQREVKTDDSSLKEDQVVPVRMVKPRI